MKKILAFLLAAPMFFALFTGCARKEPTKVKTTVGSGEVSTEEARPDERFVIGCISKMQRTAFHKTLAIQFEECCKQRGWKAVQLDCDDKLEKEQTNMETLISMGCDLIIINPQDPDVSPVNINAAVDAGIPVIAVDTRTAETGKQITTVLCDSEANGIGVGRYLTSRYGDDEVIKAVCVSGNKGNPTGLARRLGVIAGVYMDRGNLTREEAWAKAVKLERALTDVGSCKDDDIKFEIVGQAWGAWETSAALSAVEDQLVAHPDVNCMFGENDSMLLGGLKAIENRNMTDKVKIFAACDGQKEAYEAIMKNGPYLATGRNDPAECMKDAFDVAEAILNEGKTADDYERETYMKPLTVTRDNVNDVYNPNATF